MAIAVRGIRAEARQYRLNRYLFDVKIDEDTEATVIPKGFVGVVKSNVATPGVSCREEEVSTTATRGALSVPLRRAAASASGASRCFLAPTT
ncbi:MAG: hypothetical protein R3D02_07845 [Hyphomicrobiales bacterium]